MNPGLTLQEIARRLGGEVAGDPQLLVRGMATLEEAGPGDLAFLANKRYRSQLASTRASAVILGPADRALTTLPCVVVANPYAGYARVVAMFHPPRKAKPGVHPSAVIDPSATVAASAEVGPLVHIAAGAVVGERAIIGASSVVGEGAQVGDETQLVSRVTVYEACVIGARCILHAGAVVGADGFGMAPDGGRWVKIPQVGRVVVGDDVEIGANTAIDRGALGDTVIGEGVKIDNLVQVAHNVRIGAHTVIAGCTAVAGSAVIGRHCMIGGASRILGHITLVDGVTVTGCSFVTRSVREAGVYSSGVPAQPHRRWMRTLASLRRLNGAAGETDFPGEDDGTAGH